MAWQHSVGIGLGSGGSAAGSSDAGPTGGQPQATEYTLQGGQPFLQLVDCVAQISFEHHVNRLIEEYG